MKFCLRLTGLTMALATGAYAGNLNEAPLRAEITPPPMPQQAAVGSDWAGTYIGLSYARGDGTVEYDDFPAVFDYTDDRDLSVFVGRSWQDGAFVYGGELQVASGRTGLENPVMGAFPLEQLASTIELRGRAGYALDQAMAYGFLGYGISGFTEVAGTWEVSGLSYGVGLDVAVTDHIFAGIEMSRKEMSGATFNVGQTQTNTIDAVSLRLGYKF